MKVFLLLIGYCIISGIMIVLQMLVYEKWDIGLDPDYEFGGVLAMSMFWIITFIPCLFYWVAKIVIHYMEEG